MYKIFLKYFFILTIFLINLNAVDFSLLTKPMYTSITKYYGDKDIEILHIKKNANNLYLVVVKADEIDDIIIDVDGNIISITENLNNIEIEHGC